MPQDMAVQITRIAMLNTDVPVPNVRAKLGTYGAIFHRLLVNAASRVSLAVEIESTDFDVVQGEYPKNLSDVDVILITGSAASAYDNVEWVQKLDAYILDVYQNHPRVKMFGSCFGHQLICQTLFKDLGVSVEKDPNGWELGVQEIRFTERFNAALSGGFISDKRPATPDAETSSTMEDPESLKTLRLQFVHADHVRIPPTETLPSPWMLVGSSKHCAVQGVYEPGRVLTLQGHFEFDNFVNSETVKVFGALWEPERLNKALDDMDADDDAERAAEIVVRFLTADAKVQWNKNHVSGLITPPVEISA
jgi:GMP synthase-like glutamine amidotransferase